MTNNRNRIEAVLFASNAPLSGEKLKEILGIDCIEKVQQAISELNQKYEAAEHSFRIRPIAGGYQMYTLPEYSPWIEALYQITKRQRLSKAALESLSIIAYRQPVSKVEIDLIRGVQSDAPLKSLLEKRLVTITGRANTVGRPLLYGITEQFLLHFGLRDISELPRLEEMELSTGPAVTEVLVPEQEQQELIMPVEAHTSPSNPG
jgi:segregation and condensation protein B